MELINMVDSRHWLVQLANSVDWDRINELFGEDCCHVNNRTFISNRMMISMHYLGCFYNLSDDFVVFVWSENPYWQYLCGMTYFEFNRVLDPSDLANWRKRISVKGKEDLLKEITVAGLNLEILDPCLINPHIIQIKQNKTKGNNDPLAKIQSTWLYRFYYFHLKQISLVRWLLLWLWRISQPLFINTILFMQSTTSRRSKKRWRPLVRLKKFIENGGGHGYKLVDESFVDTPDPEVIPSRDQEYLVSPHDRYKAPELWVAAINNCMIYGGSNLTMVNDEVLYHDFYNFESDYTSEELHGRTMIDPRRKRIRCLLNDKEPKRIPAAASFVDACAPNYAHWMTEVLPRVAVFCADKRFKNIPIVVDIGLHRNIMEALLLVTGDEKEIYLLPIGRGLMCDTMYITSTTGYVPFEWRTKKPLDASHGVFSPVALGSMRDRIIAKAVDANNNKWPDKIFLRRNSQYRMLINSDKIEKYLTSHGFTVIEPERLNFVQQVAIFKNAKVIIGSTGAAFANLIFAPPDSKIVILISKHPDTIYWYWQNIACATGKRIKYVLGSIKDSKLNGIHASFYINIDDLSSLVENSGAKDAVLLSKKV